MCIVVIRVYDCCPHKDESSVLDMCRERKRYNERLQMGLDSTGTQSMALHNNCMGNMGQREIHLRGRCLSCTEAGDAIIRANSIPVEPAEGRPMNSLGEFPWIIVEERTGRHGMENFLSPAQHSASDQAMSGTSSQAPPSGSWETRVNASHPPYRMTEDQVQRDAQMSARALEQSTINHPTASIVSPQVQNTPSNKSQSTSPRRIRNTPHQTTNRGPSRPRRGSSSQIRGTPFRYHETAVHQHGQANASAQAVNNFIAVSSQRAAESRPSRPSLSEQSRSQNQSQSRSGLGLSGQSDNDSENLFQRPHASGEELARKGNQSRTMAEAQQEPALVPGNANARVQYLPPPSFAPAPPPVEPVIERAPAQVSEEDLRSIKRSSYSPGGSYTGYGNTPER